MRSSRSNGARQHAGRVVVRKTGTKGTLDEIARMQEELAKSSPESRRGQRHAADRSRKSPVAVGGDRNASSTSRLSSSRKRDAQTVPRSSAKVRTPRTTGIAQSRLPKARSQQRGVHSSTSNTTTTPPASSFVKKSKDTLSTSSGVGSSRSGSKMRKPQASSFPTNSARSSPAISDPKQKVSARRNQVTSANQRSKVMGKEGTSKSARSAGNSSDRASRKASVKTPVGGSKAFVMDAKPVKVGASLMTEANEGDTHPISSAASRPGWMRISNNAASEIDADGFISLAARNLIIGGIVDYLVDRSCAEVAHKKLVTRKEQDVEHALKEYRTLKKRSETQIEALKADLRVARDLIKKYEIDRKELTENLEKKEVEVLTTKKALSSTEEDKSRLSRLLEHASSAANNAREEATAELKSELVRLEADLLETNEELRDAQEMYKQKENEAHDATAALEHHLVTHATERESIRMEKEKWEVERQQMIEEAERTTKQIQELKEALKRQEGELYQRTREMEMAQASVANLTNEKIELSNTVETVLLEIKHAKKEISRKEQRHHLVIKKLRDETKEVESELNKTRTEKNMLQATHDELVAKQKDKEKLIKSLRERIERPWWTEEEILEKEELQLTRSLYSSFRSTLVKAGDLKTSSSKGKKASRDRIWK